jgi:hypothetical protein
MIAQGSSFRCGFAIVLIAKLLIIVQIPQLDDETDARARLASLGYTLYFANIPLITCKTLG